jgi:uncharacterized protein YecA (UPF0149 family)
MNDLFDDMVQRLTAKAIKSVEQRSEQLINEFKNHVDEYLTFFPENIDKKREIFESWSIQKLAGIQLGLEELTRMIQEVKKDVLNLEMDLDEITHKSKTKVKKPKRKPPSRTDELPF